MSGEGLENLKFKRIILTGAQGTGKTTILNALNEVLVEKGHNIEVLTELVRKLVKEKGIRINEDAVDASQYMIFEGYLNAFKAKDNYLSDRGLTDVLSYTISGYQDDMITRKCLSKIIKEFKEFFNNPDNYKDCLYVYFPIEFDIVDDGVRSTNKFYQKQIDQLIYMALEMANIPEDNILVVTGTVKNRVKQILNKLGLNYERS